MKKYFKVAGLVVAVVALQVGLIWHRKHEKNHKLNPPK